LLFDVFINDLCDAINYSRYLLFDDDIKIFLTIKCPEDCNLLQPDVTLWNSGLVELELHNSQKKKHIVFKY
jgi:hypothetical protein